MAHAVQLTSLMARISFSLGTRAPLWSEVYMIHRKRVSRYLAVIMRRGDDVLQRYGVYPHGRLSKPPPRCAGAGSSHGIKILRQLVHGNVVAPVMRLDELGNVFTDGEIFLVCPFGAVLAHTFGKRFVLLVKGT